MKFNMAFIKLLLSSNLIYIATMATIISIDKTSESALIDKKLIDKLLIYIMPLHYNMELRLVNDYFICDCTITIYIIHETKNISFHMLDPINNVRMWKLTQNNSEMICKNVLKNYYENNTVVFNCENVLLPGIYNLYIRVEIPINITRDSFKTPYGNHEWLITTGIQSKGQQIFPFWNNPELRITFDISIKHYRQFRALSNMPIRESMSAVGHKVWTYFNRTALIPINNVAFMVVDFYPINLTDTISLWCKSEVMPHVKFAIYVIKNVTIYLKSYWYNSKKVVDGTFVSSESKVDHVAISNLQDEVKGIFGFVFHRETDIMYNEELDTTARKIRIASSIVRRITQKYITNLLCPSYWFELWLNEGFAIFFQTVIIDKVLPNSRMMDLHVVQIQHELLDLNPYVLINSAVEYKAEEYSYLENYLFPSLSHLKGSIIWRMLEQILSRDEFSKALNVYLSFHYTKSMERTADNLWNAMQSIIDEWHSAHKFNVKNTVYSWAMQRCFPVLDVMRNYSNNVVTISAQFHNKLDEKQYYIPITYTTESKSNFTITTTNIWLTSLNSKFELLLEKDQWIILNLQQTGYYRVNYNIENWQQIALYLNSEEYRNIHVLNRAQIIDDAFHFVTEQKLEFSVFLELALYLRKEKDYIAWYPMIKAIEFISNTFVFVEFYSQFKKARELLDVEWDLFGKDSNDNYTECLKQELAKWRCVTNYASCVQVAHQQLQRHLRNLQENKISPGWKRWTYCNGLKMADHITWNSFFNFSIKEIDYTVLECLAYSDSFEITLNYLEDKLPVNFETIRDSFMTNLSYNQSKSIERAEALMANIFLSNLAKNSKYVLTHILENFIKLTFYHGKVNEMAMLTVIINNVYCKQHLDEIKKSIKDVIEQSNFSDVERKIETRWSEIERQTKFLESLFID